ncbi:MAG: NAD-dependent epimerase/dehydratase family protein, partial [Leptospiraceae bacterium]|nr:NAD-dependent epimerase/dehydratase family protein [Leptospiraceae bacterium]
MGTGLIGALSEGLKEWPQLRNPVNIGNLYCLANNADEASRIRQTIGANANVFIGDLRNQSDCSGFLKDASESVLIHTAGIIHPSRVRDFYAINRDGTLNLLEAAIEVGVYRAVVISSNSPLGVNRRNDHVFDETSPFNPYMHYGRSKMEMEQGVDRLRSRDLDAVIIRAPWFYGPHQPARQTRFFEMIRDGKFPIVGSGQNRRSMAYIDNLCAGILLAAVKPVARNQTYWIADARPYTMQEIVETVQEQLDAKGIKTARKQFHLPGIVSSFAFLADKTIQSL